MTTGINQFVRELSQTLTAERFGELPEAELVRLIAARDQTAFEAVVRKHGALVLSAARAVLADEADVADVFQATFLALWRGGARIRNGMALGPWLFGVSRRAALKASARARRRTQVERANIPQPTVDAADLSWREACGILHEEIQRLPTPYRLPIILCHLEGLSRDEAAGKLECKLDTLRGRLARAREMLKRRLIRRGVTLSAGMLAWLAGDAADATDISASLISAATRLARMSSANLPSGIIELLPNAGSMLGRKLMFAAIALLAVGMLTTTLVGNERRHMSSFDGNQSRAEPAFLKGKFVESDSADDQKQANPQNAEEPTTDSKIVLKGRVLDEHDKPVPGAKLKAFGWNGNSWFGDPVDLESDSNARFKIEMGLEPFHPGDKIRVMVVAANFAPSTSDIAAASNSDLTIRLPENAAVEGRILSLEGKPIAGAEVEITAVTSYQPGGLEKHLSKIKSGRDRFDASIEMQFFYSTWYKSAFPDLWNAATTDRDGKFQIPNVGRDRMVDLYVKGPGIETADFIVRTQSGDIIKSPNPLNGPCLYDADDRVLLSQPEHGTEILSTPFELKFRPSRLVRGTVQTKGNNKPVPGVIVVQKGVRTFAITDASGRFELSGCPKGSEYDLCATPPAGAMYFMSERQFADTPGLEPLSAKIEMQPGIEMTGRVLDEKTGKPVSGEILYVPMPGNTAVSGRRSDDGTLIRTNLPDSFKVGADGNYSIPVAPGQGLVMFKATVAGAYRTCAFEPAEAFPNGLSLTPDLANSKISFGRTILYSLERGYKAIATDDAHALVPLDLPVDAQTIHKDLKLTPATTVTVRFLDPDGKPVAPILAPKYSTGEWTTLPDGEIKLLGINPKKPRYLFVLEPKRNLIGTVSVKGTESKPVEIRLAPAGTIVGRFADANGKRLAGVRIPVLMQRRQNEDSNEDRAHIMYSLPKVVVSNEKGEFTLPGLATDCDHEIVIIDIPELGLPPTKISRLKPGETRDVGILTLRNKSDPNFRPGITVLDNGAFEIHRDK